MTASKNRQPPRQIMSGISPILRWTGQFVTIFGRPEVNPGHLPPHLQRDLGFLDGNDPRGRHR